MRAKKRFKRLLVFVLSTIMFCLSVLTVSAAGTGTPGQYPNVDAFANAASIKGMQGVNKYTWNNFGGLHLGLQNL